MEEKELLEKLKDSGLSLVDISGVGGRVLDCTPSYRNNYGFFSVVGDGFEAVVLKGVYKDFYRVVKGGSTMSEKDWSAVAQVLNDSESLLSAPLTMKLDLNNGEVQIISAALKTRPENIKNDVRDYQIPRPLTPIEYAAPASKLYDESVMLSYGFLGTLFPQTVSPLTISILEKVPDILNPIFVSSNLKTLSPSSIAVYGRLLSNMTGFEKMLKTIGIGNAIFRASFAPALYLKKAEKPGSLNKSYFPIELEEITEVMEDLKRTINHITMNSLVEESFMEYPVKLAIVSEYVFIKLSDHLGRLMKYFPSISDCLSLIFRTRENSIFYNEEPLNLPEYFDFVSPTKDVTFGCPKTGDKIQDHIKKLPFFTKMGSKGKITKIVADIHKLLDLRDDTYLTACGFLSKSNTALMQLAEFGIKKGKLKELSDVYLFEHGEVRRIAFDSFFGDTNHSINFRRWLWDRHSAQVMPYEIYGKDLENCPKIAEKMVTNALSLAEFTPLSFFPKDDEGVITSNLKLDDYDGYFIAASSLSMANLPKYKNAKGFILENAPLFGFMAEYGAINNIPIYSGIRFAPLVLDNVKVKTSKNKIWKI